MHSVSLELSLQSMANTYTSKFCNSSELVLTYEIQLAYKKNKIYAPVQDILHKILYLVRNVM